MTGTEASLLFAKALGAGLVLGIAVCLLIRHGFKQKISAPATAGILLGSWIMAWFVMLVASA